MSNNQNNQSMSNNQNQITMNNNTTIPQQEFFLTIEEAKQLAVSSPSSIWKTEDVVSLLNRIVKVKEVFVEVPTESEDDMYKSIEEQEHINGILELIEDMETSIEAIESSVDNIEVDTNNIELSLQGNEIYIEDAPIDGKQCALSDVDTLRQELKSLKSKIQQLAGKEVSNG